MPYEAWSHTPTLIILSIGTSKLQTHSHNWGEEGENTLDLRLRVPLRINELIQWRGKLQLSEGSDLRRVTEENKPTALVRNDGGSGWGESMVTEGEERSDWGKKLGRFPLQTNKAILIFSLHDLISVCPLKVHNSCFNFVWSCFLTNSKIWFLDEILSF